MIVTQVLEAVRSELKPLSVVVQDEVCGCLLGDAEVSEELQRCPGPIDVCSE
jgi:hypothetical protein